MILRLLTLLLAGLISLNSAEIMLLKEYDGRPLNGWVMSEKYDGVRAIWDTKTIKSRGGKMIAPPKWWLKKLPPIALDGELWSGRGEFEKTASVVNSHTDKGWENIKYMVFDAPLNAGSLDERLAPVKAWLSASSDSAIIIVEQRPINNPQEAEIFLDEVVKKGGEGVVLRDPKTPYINGRTDKILKYKKAYDSECEVKSTYAGRGKYAQMMGGVECEDIKSGVRFKIGSGFSDEQRRAGLQKGTIITYKYRGLTKNGKPRFATFWRIYANKGAL